MEETQALTPGRFLELLNKEDRNMQEENDLQTELKRQAAEKVKAEATPAENTAVDSAPEVAESTTSVTPAAAQPQDVSAQPEASVAQEGNTAYDLTQLSDESQAAIEFLATQPNTLAVEMAQASFTQAAYWTKLASQGK